MRTAVFLGLWIASLAWARPLSDSIIAQWSLEQQVGQLLMVPVYPKKGPKHWKKVADQIRQDHIGGVIVMQGTLAETYAALETLRTAAPYPLMIAIDAEWGLNMRIADGPRIPLAMTLGAVEDTSLVRRMGFWVGMQLKALGIQWNFAPVVDVNTNPANPVIHWRAFSSDPERVARQADAFARGLQQADIAYTLKHFPGHGDTYQDSHYHLPRVDASRKEMEQIHLLPYRHLAPRAPGVMVAHILVPSLGIDSLPASLSPQSTDILRHQVGFQGLIFTDALNMKALKHWGQAHAAVLALQAGAQVLLFPTDVRRVRDTILQAIQQGQISRAQVKDAVQRIVAWKTRHPAPTPLPLDSIQRLFNHPIWRGWVRQTITAAQTLVKDVHRQVPLSPHRSYRWVIISNHLPTHVVKALWFFRQGDIEFYTWDDLSVIQPEPHTWLLLFPPNLRVQDSFGLDASQIQYLQRLAAQAEGVVVFSTPYFLPFVDAAPAIAVAYEQGPDFQSIAIQCLFGARPYSGVLPFQVGKYPVGHGLKRPSLRLGFGLPEEVGMDSRTLQRIDSLMETAIRQGATPGGRVLIARKGLIVWDRTYGFFTYDSLLAVDAHTLYDLASITKIAATTLAVMKLYEEGKIRLDVPIQWYLPELQGTPKGKLTIRELLTHTAGLKDWIPFYRRWKKDSLQLFLCSADTVDGFFCIPVTNGVVAAADLPDSLWQWIIRSPVQRRGRYRYSDLGFYILQKIIERRTHQGLDEYVRRHFYDTLHLSYIGYRPLERFARSQIAPTEIDTYFRHRIVWGTVHDPGAALLGGVAGHAGLFSDAYDLATLMQMLMNGGTYGGVRLLDSTTVRLFTSKATRRYRRGLGFDKPDFFRPDRSPTCTLGSLRTFGHLGFTGTATWADPEYQLVYVLLSNRTYPSMYNRRFNQLSVRTRTHCIAYEAIQAYEAQLQHLLSSFSPKQHE